MASRDRTTSPTPASWVVAVLCATALAACTSSHPSSAGSTSALSSPATTTSSGPSASPVSSAPASPADSAAASAGVASSPASAPSPLAIAATPTPTPTPTATATPTPTPTAKPVPTPPKPAPTPTSTAPTPLLVQQLKDVGNAQQVVIVTSSSWSTDVATLQTFEEDAGGWRAVFPAMAANIGRDGFSATKVEGDLKTPAGKYGFGTMFGQLPSPKVKFPYRVADSKSVWVDDPSSTYYNTWREDVALTEGEDLAAANFKTAYAYAVDIAYNANPVVKGKGSAIFLHVGNGRGGAADGTAGCVSIAQPNLLKVLRWLDPARAPIIVMAPTSVIRQY